MHRQLSTQLIRLPHSLDPRGPDSLWGLIAAPQHAYSRTLVERIPRIWDIEDKRRAPVGNGATTNSSVAVAVLGL